jgi:multiple sugar transport system permease protein
MKLNPKVFWYGALVCAALAMIGPFWVMISTSLMGQAQVYKFPPDLFPNPIHWDNYLRVFQQVPMARYFFNSVFIAVLTTIGQVFLCAMAAYGFSRLSFPGKNVLFLLFLVTLMIPPQVNIVPLFFVMKLFHWVDTYQGLIIPGLFGAFGVFLLRQWFNGLPKELEEAATIDGCNPFQVFWSVALPLAKPALVALAIFIFINSWNSFMWPLILTQSDSLRTLPVGISALKSSYRDITDWSILMAASTLSILPIVLVFLVGQRQFIQGILQGGVKE